MMAFWAAFWAVIGFISFVYLYLILVNLEIWWRAKHPSTKFWRDQSREYWEKRFKDTSW